MAAKKTASKTTKKTATKKKAGKKAPAKAGGKKAPARKAAAKKKEGARKSAGAKKTGVAAPESRAKPEPASTARSKPQSEAHSEPAAKAAKKKTKGGFSSLQVNMGQIFALRPRVATSFKPDDFRAARHQLEEETYADAAEAARAVAEKALELTHGVMQQGRKGRSSRRW